MRGCPKKGKKDDQCRPESQSFCRAYTIGDDTERKAEECNHQNRNGVEKPSGKVADLEFINHGRQQGGDTLDEDIKEEDDQRDAPEDDPGRSLKGTTR